MDSIINKVRRSFSSRSGGDERPTVPPRTETSQTEAKLSKKHKQKYHSSFELSSSGHTSPPKEQLFKFPAPLRLSFARKTSSRSRHALRGRGSGSTPVLSVAPPPTSAVSSPVTLLDATLHENHDGDQPRSLAHRRISSPLPENHCGNCGNCGLRNSRNLQEIAGNTNLQRYTILSQSLTSVLEQPAYKELDYNAELVRYRNRKLQRQSLEIQNLPKRPQSFAGYESLLETRGVIMESACGSMDDSENGGIRFSTSNDSFTSDVSQDSSNGEDIPKVPRHKRGYLQRMLQGLLKQLHRRQVRESLSDIRSHLGSIDKRWPLYSDLDHSIIIHPRPVNPALLADGDTYFCLHTIRGHGTSRIRLSLRQMIGGQVFERRGLMMMEGSDWLFANGTADWTNHITVQSDTDLAALLGHMCVAAQKGVERLTEGGVASVNRYHSENSKVNGTTDSNIVPCVSAQDYFESQDRASVRHRRDTDGNWVKVEPPPCELELRTPKNVQEVHQELLQSSAVLYPGRYDIRGGSVILVSCHNVIWNSPICTPRHLAEVILYYLTLPSDTTRSLGTALVVDARSTTLQILNTLLEAVYITEANRPKALAIVHVLTDKLSQALLFRSPEFRPQANLQINLVNSVSSLYKFVDAASLPAPMGGTLMHNHGHWVRFRQDLETLLTRCRVVARHLVTVLHDVATVDTIPATPGEIQRIIQAHEDVVENALSDPRLVELEEQGESAINKLNEMCSEDMRSDDYRDSLATVRSLYVQIQDGVFKLCKLAEIRSTRLNHCLELRQFEVCRDEVLHWISTEGQEMLAEYAAVADGKTIRKQKKSFDKSYFNAMKHIEQGKSVLEDASSLAELEDPEHVTEVTEVAQRLKINMKTFTSDLDVIRDRIENSAQCYHLLDKAYEWALNSTKYVQSLTMDASTSPDHITRLQRSLGLYLQDNPPLTEETFGVMIELAQRLHNAKLEEQCFEARSRCMETQELLTMRQQTFERAKERLQQDTMFPTSTPTTTTTTQPPPSKPAEPLTSTPMSQQPLAMLRRRSYAGNASSPLYSSTAAAFKDKDSHVEEYLFGDGLITADMSDRVVASLPKGLSTDSRLRASRESLRGSCENLASDQQHQLCHSSAAVPRLLDCNSSLDNKTPSTISVNNNKHYVRTTSTGTDAPSPEDHLTSAREAVQHRRVMRRIQSAPTGTCVDQDMCGSYSSRLNKTLSMITGSTDSLPSMPEEDDSLLSASATPEDNPSHEHPPHGHTPDGHKDTPPSGHTPSSRAWSPVTTNNHLREVRRVVSTEGAPPSRRTSPPKSNLTSYHSMADLRLSDEDVKRRRTLELVMKEIVETERDYVKSLKFVVDHYMSELLRDDVPPALRGKRNLVFGNLEQIYHFHSRYFLTKLDQCKSPYLVCHLFLEHAPDFYLYALYNKNKPMSDQLMSEHGTKFFREKQIILGDRLDLSSYLLKPVQRMGKYALLLQQILKESTSAQQEYNDLKAALEIVQFQLRHGNDLLAMDCLKHCDVSLAEQGRLLRQEEFLVWQGRKKSMRHIFLFEDLILFSKTRRGLTGHDQYVYKMSIKMSEIGLTETVGRDADSSGLRFGIWFRRRGSRDTYTLQAADAVIRNLWVRDISRLLWKQAIRSREVRMAEMSRMGMGSKPCLDLKPSKDNIQDRFINVNLPRGVCRTRNSIAVSSFDHLKNTNKRPHSIISISSTSSSSSSGASLEQQQALLGNPHCVAHAGQPSMPMTGGLSSPPAAMHCVGTQSGSGMFGTPQPTALESLLDSSSLTKTYTVYSNESGIVADLANSSEDACTQTTLKRGARVHGNAANRRSVDEAICLASDEHMTAHGLMSNHTLPTHQSNNSITLSTEV